MPNASEMRRHHIFRTVVREYFKSVEPVGSETVAAKCRLGVSSATIRNDMADLEELGLLEQPYTSAGRVPTERGYRFYVETFVGEDEVSARERERLAVACDLMHERAEVAAKEFVKTVAALTDETVFMSFGSDHIVVTGVSNLLRKPEFNDVDILRGFASAIDELDRLIEDVRGRLSRDVEVLIGEENPFGSELSTIVARYEAGRFGQGVIGILGPTRMDYDANVALARHLHNILSRL